MNTPLLIAALLVLAVLILTGAAVAEILERRAAYRKHFLKRLEQGGNPIQPKARAERVALMQKDSPLQQVWALFPAIDFRNLPAGTVKIFVPLAAASAVLGGLAVQILSGHSLMIGVVGGIAFAMLIFLMWVKMRTARRRAAISDAMPEALDLIVRTLRVGLPVSAALKLLGDELQGPLAEEFRDLSEKVAYGQEISDAIYEMAFRHHNQDLHFLAAAVSIQMVTGGNLANVLERLSLIARSRHQLRRKIDSMTAEARWSGRFLTAFPPLAIATMAIINPAYFDGIYEQSWFVPMTIVIFVLLALNLIYMRWLAKLD